jgi:hypothetical protein
MERSLSDGSRRDYLAWCARNGIEGEFVDRCIRRGMRVVPEPARRRLFEMFYGWRVPSFRDYFFPWAMQHRMNVYRRVAPTAHAARRRAPAREMAGAGA